MTATARDVMTVGVRTVGPEMALPELERVMIEEKRRAFPVLEEGRLVGLVSRSDVVRQLCVERSLAETLSEFYVDAGGFDATPEESLEALAERVGARIGALHVRDVMIRRLVTVAPEATLREVAGTLIEHHIHRVPVVEGGQLVGIVSSLDLVRLFAEDRIRLR